MSTIVIDELYLINLRDSNGDSTIYITNENINSRYIIKVTQNISFNIKSVTKANFEVFIINASLSTIQETISASPNSVLSGRFYDGFNDIFTGEPQTALTNTLEPWNVTRIFSYFGYDPDPFKAELEGLKTLFIIDNEYHLISGADSFNVEINNFAGNLSVTDPVLIQGNLDVNGFINGNIETTDTTSFKYFDIHKHSIHPTLSCGFYYTFFLTSSDQAYSCGINDYGQLGLGDTVNRDTPTLIPNFDNITAISGAYEHSLLLTSTGNVYSFGGNYFGQLGLGDTVDRDTPTLIPNFDNIIAISCGNIYSLFLTSNGKVYSFGNNDYGQLGLGDNVDRSSPTLIPNLNNIVSIVGSEYHSIFLTSTGNVYTCGRNSYGQLGLGDNVDRNSPTLILNLNNVISIASGAFHTFFILSSGKAYSCGINNYGQLGLGTSDLGGSPNPIPQLIPNFNNIIAIECGYSHSILLLSSGRAYSFGTNDYGQLGLGSSDTDPHPIPTLIPNLNNVIAVSCGRYYSANLTSNGKVYSFGRNTYGQLGLGDTDNRNTPTLITSIDPIKVNTNYVRFNNNIYGSSLLSLGTSSNVFNNPLTITSVSGKEAIVLNVENETTDANTHSRFSIGYSGNELSFNKLQPNSYIRFNDLSNYDRNLETELYGNSELCIYKGNVGIGNLAEVNNLGAIPMAKLHITQSQDSDFTIEQTSKKGDGIILENNHRLKWSINVSEKDTISSENRLIFDTTNLSGGWGNGYLHSTIDAANIDFTGQHKSLANKNIDTSYVGLIVSSNGSYVNLDNSLEPSINESLPVCNISNIDYDKTVFGVISDKEEEDTRTYTNGVWASVFIKQNNNENRLIVNSLGEGGMWICNKNGPLQNGDYITSCSVPGYGMKQITENKNIKNYTVAKITCDCNFSLTKIVKQKLLVNNNNIVYGDSGDLQYVDDLDSEGNQQSVYKYETRFLDSQGNLLDDENDYNDRLTNEAEVYIACFVGCTYHCG